MKACLRLTLFICLLLTAATASAQTWSCGSPTANAVTATLSGGVFTISGTGNMANYGVGQYGVSVPWYSERAQITSVVIGSSITGISDYAFYQCPNLDTVTIPSSVTYIGSCAFQECTNLRKATILNPTPPTYGLDPPFVNVSPYFCLHVPKGAESNYLTNNLWNISWNEMLCINDSCVGLTPKTWNCGSPTADAVTATLCKGVLTVSGTGAMEDYANYSSTPWRNYTYGKIGSVVIDSGVTRIGNNAFSNFTNLREITLPNGITSIGNSAFSSCNRLTEITVLNPTPPVVSSNAFSNVPAGLCAYVPQEAIAAYAQSSSWNGFSCINGCQRIGVAGSNVWYTLCDSTLTISGTGAMSSYTYQQNPTWYSLRTQIARVVVNSGITNIGDRVFYNLTSLREVTLPNGITSIGNSAFSYCTSLREISIIPDGVTSIGEGAFIGCSSLTSIIMPNSVTTIGQSAFAVCTSLTEITIPDSVTIINQSLFGACYNLSRLTLGSSVTSFDGNFIFEDCNRLTEITILNPTPPLFHSGIFSWVNYIFTSPSFCLYVPPAAIGSYARSSGWNTFKCVNGCQKIAPAGALWYTLCGGTLTIGGTGAMDSYSSGTAPWYSLRSQITRVVVENGVTSIGSYAFFGCTSLAEVAISNSVTSIGDNAFGNCVQLSSITIPGNVARIDRYAFQSCTKLSSVTLDSGVISIGNNAFYLCPIPSITIPASVVSIEYNAFIFCSILTSVTLQGLTPPALGLSAFASAPSNFCVSVPPEAHSAYFASSEWRNFLCTQCLSGSAGSSATWSLCLSGQLTIEGTGAMDNYSWDGSVSSAPWYPYRSYVTSLVVDEGITSIGSSAFMGCSNLPGVVIPESVASVGSSAFSGCSSLAGITIGSGVASIGDYAFSGCPALTSIVSLRHVPPTVYPNTFTGVPLTCCVYVPSGLELTYRTTPYWSRFASCTPQVVLYTINFDAQGGSPTPPLQTVLEDYYATQPISPTRAGFVFDGWYEDNIGWSTAWDFNDLIERSMTLYAKWTRVYTVTFNAMSGSATPPQTVRDSSFAAEPTPAPTRTGYLFGGWYADTTGWRSGGGTLWGFDTCAVTSDTMLHAKWTAAYCTVTFSAQGGSATDPQTVQNGGLAQKPADPTRENYTFGGWVTAAGGSTTWRFDVDRVTRDTTLYALWSVTPRTVSFEPLNGEEPFFRVVNSGSLVAQPAPNPTRIGYTFGGWYGDNIGWSTAWNFSTSTVTSDTTLYAKWTLIPVYTVTFNARGGNTVLSQSVQQYDTVSRPADPTRSSHVFDGWYTDSTTWSTAWNFGTVVNANITLYAKWIPIYTVTFSDMWGSAVFPQLVLAGDTAAEPTPEPTRTGHTFGGWYAESDTVNNYSGTAWNFSTPINAHLMLYAKWLINMHTVTFVDLHGGTVTPPQDVAYGSTAGKPVHIRTGYTLVGWYADTAGFAWDFSTSIICDTTLYARWGGAGNIRACEGKDFTISVPFRSSEYTVTYRWYRAGVRFGSEVTLLPTANPKIISPTIPAGEEATGVNVPFYFEYTLNDDCPDCWTRSPNYLVNFISADFMAE